eukprot:gene3626-6442_t
MTKRKVKTLLKFHKIESKEVLLERFGHTLSCVKLNNGNVYYVILGGIETHISTQQIVASEKNELIKDRKLITTLFYNLTSQNWVYLKEKGRKPSFRFFHTCCTYKNSIYVVGGVSFRHLLNDFYQFDLETSQWIELPSLPFGLFGHSSKVVSKKCVIFGGLKIDKDGKIITTNDTLVYKFESKQMKNITESNHELPSRCFHSSTVNSSNTIMFVYGGMQLVKEKGKVVKRVMNDLWMMNIVSSQKNDDITGIWLPVIFEKIPPSRFGHFGFFMSDKVIFIGSSDEEKTVLCYDLSDPVNLKRVNPNSIFYNDNPDIFESLEFNDLSFAAMDINKSQLLYTGGASQSNTFLSNIFIELKKFHSETAKPSSDAKRILMLGKRSSGKSALARNIFNQFGQTEYSQKKLNTYKSDFYYTILTLFAKFLSQMEIKNEKIQKCLIELQKVKLQTFPTKILSIYKENYELINELWKDEEIQQKFDQFSIDFPKGTKYLFEKIPDLEPSKDIVSGDLLLMSEQKKSSINFYNIDYQAHDYVIFDTHELPHDSRKLQCIIDNLSCAIYMIDSTNYIQENFFERELEKILEYRDLLSDIPFVICFNMIDLMDDYLEQFPFFNYFENENEEEINNSKNEVIKKIISMFKILTANRVYIHVVCSLDDEDVNDLFDCIHQILSRSIESCNCSDRITTHNWDEVLNYCDISIFTYDSKKG